MAEVTFTVSDEVAAWIEDRVATGEYQMVSDYVLNTILHDRMLREPDNPLTLDELRALIVQSRASGTVAAKVEDAFEVAMRIVGERQDKVA